HPSLALRSSARIRAVLHVAMPGDDEIAEGSGGDGGNGLTVRRVRVDAELRAEGSAGAGIALAEDTLERAIREVAGPDDDEVAGGVRRYCRKGLIARRERVHPELRSDGGAGAGVALSEDAVARAVLTLTGHHHDDVARAGGGEGGEVL